MGRLLCIFFHDSFKKPLEIPLKGLAFRPGVCRGGRLCSLILESEVWWQVERGGKKEKF